VIGRQSAAGDDAMQVGMEVQILPPAMEHAEETERQAEPFRIAGDGEQGFGGGAKENVVDGVFVVEGDGGNRLGQSKDHVKVVGG